MRKFLLIIALLISALGLNAQSVTIGDLKFTVTSETPAECEVSGYSGEPVNVTIPSTVTISGKEYSVTSIGESAFRSCSSLTSIEIPSGVTSIGDNAFRSCSSLTSIEIPSGVTSIGDDAFCWCSSLTSIEFEENSQLTSIGSSAFFVCSSLTSIEFEENSQLTSIGGGAFGDCYSLTSIELPSGVTSIGDYAFDDCSSLTSIDFGENSQLASIGDYAFDDCSSLTSIDFGENSKLTSIGNYVFGDCSSLTSIEIPSGVTSIEEHAFYGCSSLTSIEIPSGVTSIEEHAFQYCESLTSIVVESGNTVYDSRDNCNAIIETATNTLIVGCQNTVIPNTVTSIGDHAFSTCSSLTSIEIPSGVTSIGDHAFSSCSSLTSIEFEENSQLTSIGGGVFSYCSSLTSIEIPSGVTSIGNYAFGDCSSLTSIEIPSGVTSIGGAAFSGCSSLTSVTFGENSKLTSIGSTAFYGCSSLTSIEIPSGATEIEYGTFSKCSSLTSIDFGENSQLTSIGNDAFDDCSSLISIELPSGVTSIGDGALEECSSLTSIEFEENSQLTSIGKYAFYRCYSLTSIEIPSGVTSIGDHAFSGCSKLTSIEIPSGVTSIGSTAFSGCSKLTSIEIPSSVTSIESSAFAGCFSLTSIEIPSGVTSIGDYAFSGCSSLTSISCHAESVPETGSNAFNYCPLDMVIYVPEQSVDAYKAASPWIEYTILAMPNYEIAVVIAPSESGVVTGAGTYNHGEDVTLTATANEGYKFINWTENGEVVSEEAEYSFEITKDRNLVANFELLSYNVTASVNPENAGVVNGAGTYNHGEDVTLTATANEGYKFVNWTENGEVVSEEAEYSFEITKDRNLVANFELLSYNVTASVNPENAGVVTGAGTYNHGEDVTLTVTANEGYKFINWTENGEVVSEEAEYSFEITNDRNLVANFEEIEDPENPGENDETCTITAVANPKEGGSISGTGTYKKDMKVTLTATAKSGFEFVNWTENGVIVSIESEYSFTVTKDISLVANFVALEYEVIVVVNPKVAGEVEGAGTYKKNTSVTLTATANEGYKFVSWAENGEVISETSEYSFVVTRDVELIANFVSTEGVEELASSFDIYPNPVNDKLYIETLTQTQTVEIYDVYGRLQVTETPSHQDNLSIDVTSLNSGVYFVKIVTSEGEAVKRFIKD